MGSSQKWFIWKIKKQARDLGTADKEKIADSSFSQKHENDVTGEKKGQHEILADADLEYNIKSGTYQEIWKENEDSNQTC